MRRNVDEAFEMKRTLTPDEIDENLHPTVRHITNNINKRQGHIPVEENQRLQLNCELLDYVKDKYGLWPVEEE